MREVKIWDHVLKSGLAQKPALNPTLNSTQNPTLNPTLLPDPDTWSGDNFKMMEITLQNCLSSEEFSQKVHPYKKLLKYQLYEVLLNSYLDPDKVLIGNILLPKNIKIDEIIDSKIVNLNIISIISRWIDKIDNNKFAHLREFYLPYKFELLLRGSSDGKISYIM